MGARACGAYVRSHGVGAGVAAQSPRHPSVRAGNCQEDGVKEEGRDPRGPRVPAQLAVRDVLHGARSRRASPLLRPRAEDARQQAAPARAVAAGVEAVARRGAPEDAVRSGSQGGGAQPGAQAAGGSPVLAADQDLPVTFVGEVHIAIVAAAAAAAAARPALRIVVVHHFGPSLGGRGVHGVLGEGVQLLRGLRKVVLRVRDRGLLGPLQLTSLPVPALGERDVVMHEGGVQWELMSTEAAWGCEKRRECEVLLAGELVVPGVLPPDERVTPFPTARFGFPWQWRREARSSASKAALLAVAFLAEPCSSFSSSTGDDIVAERGDHSLSRSGLGSSQGVCPMRRVLCGARHERSSSVWAGNAGVPALVDRGNAVSGPLAPVSREELQVGRGGGLQGLAPIGGARRPVTPTASHSLRARGAMVPGGGSTRPRSLRAGRGEGRRQRRRQSRGRAALAR
eukprot:scaffold3086_cov393-Prasinococcus_capsulatus_cf.AAC.1